VILVTLLALFGFSVPNTVAEGQSFSPPIAILGLHRVGP